MAWWLSQHLVTVVVLAGIVHAATRVFRAGPVTRHALWTIVLIKLVLPPVFAWPWSVEVMPASTRHVEAEELALSGGPGTTDRSSDPSVQETLVTPPTPRVVAAASPTNWQALGWLVWIAGTCVFAVVHGTRAWRMRRLVKTSRPVSGELQRQFDAVARTMKLPPVEIRLASISSPFVWGGLRPVVLWPDVLPHSIHSHAVDGLLAHELAHVKRRDHWIGWIELAAGCAWWWNPLFWHVRHRIRANAELACDAWAAEVVPHGRRHYAEALLALSAAFPSLPAPMPAIGVRSGNRRLMERRLAMIMRARVPVRLSRLALCTGAFIAALAFPAWAQRPSTATTARAPQPAAQPAQPTATTQPMPVPAEAGGVIHYVPAQRRGTAGQTVTIRPVIVGASGEGETFESVLPVSTQYFESEDSDMPAEARELVRKFSETSAQKLREAREAIARERTGLIEQLQKLQDAEAKAGHLDQALSIRSRVRSLQRGDFQEHAIGGRIMVAPDELEFSQGFAVSPPPPPAAPAAPRPSTRRPSPPQPPPAPGR